MTDESTDGPRLVDGDYVSIFDDGYGGKIEVRWSVRNGGIVEWTEKAVEEKER